jgi:hypothetical protein
MLSPKKSSFAQVSFAELNVDRQRLLFELRSQLLLSNYYARDYTLSALETRRNAQMNWPQWGEQEPFNWGERLPDRLIDCEGFWLRGYGGKSAFHSLELSTSVFDSRLELAILEGGDGKGVVSNHGIQLIKSIATVAPIFRGEIRNSRYNGWMMQKIKPTYKSCYSETEREVDCFSLIKVEGEPPYDVELDTSKNPGRVEIIHGKIQSVAADMWFGPTFWPEAACTPEEVRAQPWLKIEETEHYMHINCWPEPFTRPDGEQGELQKKLWRLLFKSDCEWPPNGGVPQPVPLPEPPPKPTVTMRVDFS